MSSPPAPTAARIGPADRDDLPAIQAIEVAAAALFPGEDLPAALAEDPFELAELERARAEGRLWVARAPEGAPLGFALVERLDGVSHLEELDVHPDHGRQGLGRALLEWVCQEARRAGDPAVTLVTFRHLAWNAPFYGRAGFRILAEAEWTPGLRAKLEAEVGKGLDPAKRVAMRRELALPVSAGSP